MSANAAPASGNLARVACMMRQPNPVWVRELRQAARIKRTPFVLMSVTVVAAIAMGAVSGVAPDDASPAQVGAVLYQVFFSIAFFVISLVGPAVGANNIASEREGRTWEPLMLTGFPAESMARGKLLSAMTSVLQYLAILTPVGALPFLFGGVSATEVILAFLCLVVLCALGVGFGLAVGSSISSGRSAIVVAIVAAAVLAVGAYYVLGIMLSKQAYSVLRVVSSGRPVWFPTALANAPVSADYVVLLVVQPFVGVVVAGWFFREVTVANMTGAFKDRSSGLLRWLAGSTCLIVVALGAPLFVDGANWLDGTSMRALGGMAVFTVATALVLQGTPTGSVRVGPNLTEAMGRLLGCGLAGLLLLTATALAVVALRVGDLFVDVYLWLIASAGAYFGSFVVFVVGVGAWLRVRLASVAVARAALAVTVLIAVAGPFVLALLTSVLQEGTESTMDLAAASPAYVLRLSRELASSTRHEALARTGCCVAGWALTGALFFAAALWRQRFGGSTAGALPLR